MDDLHLSAAHIAVWENAQDGQSHRWQVSDDQPSGARIQVLDDSAQGKVIAFSGQGTQNAYRYQGE